MSRRFLTRGAPALLLLSLTVNVVFVSCAADTPTSPIAQDANAEILAQLAAMSVRLDSIDARTQRIDEGGVLAVESIVASLSDPQAQFIQNLLDAVELSADIRAEVCAELGGKLGGEYSLGIDAEGGAHGEAGPNVLEAEVQGKVQARLKGEWAVNAGLEGTVTGSICAGAGAALAMDLPAAAEAMRNALASLGIDGSTMTTLINQIDLPSTASYSATASTVRSAMPLPGSLQGALDNPASILSNSPELAQFAIDMRCDPSAFPNGSIFEDAQTRLCALDVPDAETYLAILNGLSGLPNTVATIGTGVQTVCNTVNALVPKSLVIPSVSVNFGSVIGTYQVFPGYNSRLFPGVPTVAC